MTVAERPEVRRYCDDLLLALRIEEVPGTRIGEVLTEVRAHLAESGEDPEEAFGAPADYAAALSADAPPESWRAWLTTRAGGAALFLGAGWLVEGASALLVGDRGEVRAGVVLLAVLVGLVAPWVVDQVGAPARGAAAAGRTALVLLVLSAGGVAVALVGGRSTPVPAWLLVAAGLVLAGAAALAFRGLADPVVDPFATAEEVSAVRRRHGVAAGLVLWGSLALMAAAGVAVAVLVEHLA